MLKPPLEEISIRTRASRDGALRDHGAERLFLCLAVLGSYGVSAVR